MEYTKVINSNTVGANTENARSAYVACETVGCDSRNLLLSIYLFNYFHFCMRGY